MIFYSPVRFGALGWVWREVESPPIPKPQPEAKTVGGWVGGQPVWSPNALVINGVVNLLNGPAYNPTQAQRRRSTNIT